MGYLIRLASEADAGAIRAIYAPYVLETPITFETEVPSEDEMAGRVRETSALFPYIVCCNGSRIAGYAYAHKLRERAAYAWDAELSVYVDKANFRRGIGKALYAVLIDILKLQNIQNVYGCVTVPNPNSERLHDAFGFRRAGEFRNTGYKLGTWLDVRWYEKSIGGHETDPQPFMPVTQIDKNAICGILKAAAEKIPAEQMKKAD
jgi:L-amino acid N-acyltransferase YncA